MESKGGVREQEREGQKGIEESESREREEYRFKDIVTGVVLSQPFQMRSKQ